MSMPASSTKPVRLPWLRRPALLAAATLSVAALTAGTPVSASALPAPQVTVNATTMSPYGALNVMSVSGFGPNDALTFTIDGVDVTNELVNTTTDATGAITTSLGNLRLPGANGGSVGTHTLTVTDASAKLQATASLLVVPSPTPTPTPAVAQRTVSQMTTVGVTVRFSGFTPGDSVIIGMANQDNGAQCGATVVATPSGTATGTCVWDAAYLARFGRSGSTPGSGAFIIGANNTIYTMYATPATVTVTPNPATPPPPPPSTAPRPVAPPATADPTPSVPAATPAVPVSGTAHFTG